MMGYGGMMGGYGGFGAPGIGFGLIWQIIWLVIIVAVIYVLINQLGRKDTSPQRSGNALEILKERLARGEIDYEEYVRIRENLES